MNTADRIKAFAQLGALLREFLKNENTKDEGNLAIEKIKEAVNKAFINNAWFTPGNIKSAIEAWANLLTENNLENWLSHYPAGKLENGNPQVVGIIMAGNIPMVGFHDFLSVLMSGHKVKAKLASDDKYLIPALADALIEFEPGFEKYISFTEGRLDQIDALIATGSNNTARYFEYYFGKYPHIIRKNRNSVAVITGDEKKEDLALLGKDIFQYFGLGCRNVSKLFVPHNYDFAKFYEGIFEYNDIINFKKYASNYDYNKTVYLMSKVKLWDNGFLLLKEDIGMSSPMATLFFEYYNPEDIESRLLMDSQHIQCVVSEMNIEGALPFGETQNPKLMDYADKVDTIDFLINL